VTGVCGWAGSLDGDASAVLGAMLGHSARPDATTSDSVAGDRFGLGAYGPARTFHVANAGPFTLAWQGHPHWIGQAGGLPSPAEFSARFLAVYRDAGPAAIERIQGDFAIAVFDGDAQRVLLAVDRIGIKNVVYAAAGDALAFGPTCDAVAAFPGTSRRVDRQAIYDYIHFHMVPGPGTVFEGFRRLEAGHYLLFEKGRAISKPYWEMRFVEDARGDFPALKKEFRTALRTGVEAFGGPGPCGAFLSGGTDSSTVSGLLGEISGQPVPTFSIGFEATGYDEMEYARIAARHFKTDQHEYYVTPADVVEALPMVAEAYDQPFGNASAVPTYFCAKLARESGVMRMLGGDGGDELFGGNVRYTRQQIFALYERLPAVLRRSIIEPVLFGIPGAGSLPVLRKAKSYVTQARLPMPARYETYNLLERLRPENVFSPDFLASVDRGHPLELMASTWGTVHASSLINRMLALDLKFTLADNDLPKVTRMCEMAGVDIAFPLLHEAVISFSAKLAPDLKLRGRKLRYFFKEALRDFLPNEIITKTKHGFGLPAGVWIRDHPPLNRLAADLLASLRSRKIFRDDFLASLLGEQFRAHPGYYGTMVWILMMLELWFDRHGRP
jgi:asparagine synthase (glutamine-hydrolysing)